MSIQIIIKSGNIGIKQILQKKALRILQRTVQMIDKRLQYNPVISLIAV